LCQEYRFQYNFAHYPVISLGLSFTCDQGNFKGRNGRQPLYIKVMASVVNKSVGQFIKIARRS
jgi:hypothetical protein